MMPTPTNPGENASASQSPRELLTQLQARYAVIREMQVLALGIHKAILARHPEINRQVLRLALKTHTASTRYLKVLATQGERFGLEGQVDGVVTDEQRDLAAATLRERIRKQKDAQAGQRRAAAEARRKTQAETQKQEKLQQLAERFPRR